jgi:hypothetical protein
LVWSQAKSSRQGGGSPIFVVGKAAASRLAHNKNVCEAPQALSSREESRHE